MMHQDELRPYIAFKCIVGSQAYGLAGPGSDTDRKGIFIPPTRLFWGLDEVPEQIETHDPDEVYYEVGKFVRLALKANPTILECLYTPLVEEGTDNLYICELLKHRHRFLSKRIVTTHIGYSVQQLERMHRAERNGNTGLRWKHAMHSVRLIIAGIHVLKTDTMMVDMAEFREELLKIRAGHYSMDYVVTLRNALHSELCGWEKRTQLPDEPDVVWADAWLRNVRAQMCSQ